MDLFADAVEDFDTTWAKKGAGANLPPSQFLAPCQAMARSQEEIDLTRESVETSDPTLSADLTTEALIARGPEKPGKAKGTKRASSAKVEGKPSPKRQCDPKLKMKFKEILEVDDNLVHCVQHASCRHHLPVPLWRQYRVSWRETDLKDAKWILVSSQEPWVKGLVNSVTSKPVRKLASKFYKLFWKEWQTSVDDARKSRNLMSLSDDEDDEVPVKWRADKVPAVIDITMGGFTITCLNSKRKMALKINDKTVSFISSFVVHYVKWCEGSNPKKEKVASASVEDQSQGYRQAASKTPNHRDRVVWRPTKHKWALLLKSQRGHLSEEFVVNDDQPADAYEKEKWEKYWLAVKAWNDLDGSKRERIEVQPVEESDQLC